MGTVAIVCVLIGQVSGLTDAEAARAYKELVRQGKIIETCGPAPIVKAAVQVVVSPPNPEPALSLEQRVTRLESAQNATNNLLAEHDARLNDHDKQLAALKTETATLRAAVQAHCTYPYPAAERVARLLTWSEKIRVGYPLNRVEWDVIETDLAYIRAVPLSLATEPVYEYEIVDQWVRVPEIGKRILYYSPSLVRRVVAYQ